MDNTVNVKKLFNLIFFCVGVFIGALSDPIEIAGSDHMHAILAVVIALVLPLWFILIARIDKHFSTNKKIHRAFLNKITLAYIALGIFVGRIFLLEASGIPINSAVIISAPFLGAFVGTLLAVLYDR